MSVKVVSGFVPLQDNPKGVATYDKLGTELLDALVPHMEHRIGMFKHDIESCWMYNFLQWRRKQPTWSVSDNPEKNTLAYHVVQHQKSEWLYLSASFDPTADVYVWIDYGILGVPGVTVAVILDAINRASRERSIVIPGCWGKSPEIDSAHPCWRFCGGLVVVPREHIYAFDVATKQTAINQINATNNVEWEVNTWARMELQHPELPLWWFQADHNEKMFTNYPQVVYAG